MILATRQEKPSIGSGRLRPVRDAGLGALQRLLDGNPSADPYQASAAYFALTGRDGLWLAGDDEAALLVCRHPHLADELVVFPPFGRGSIELLARTIEDLPAGGAGLTLGRATAPLADALGSALPGRSWQRRRESLLDWGYPVHVLDTAKVAAHRGRGFQPLRTDLHKIDRGSVEAVDLDPVRHGAAVREIVRRWRHAPEMLAPYERLLELFGRVRLAGRLILHRGAPAGFAIWDEPAGQRGRANAFAHIGLHEIVGMPRLVVLDMAETLCRRGIAEVCVGGSETAGLDLFKRQLRPVRSVQLDSWRLLPG